MQRKPQVKNNQVPGSVASTLHIMVFISILANYEGFRTSSKRMTMNYMGHRCPWLLFCLDLYTHFYIVTDFELPQNFIIALCGIKGILPQFVEAVHPFFISVLGFIVQGQKK